LADSESCELGKDTRMLSFCPPPFSRKKCSPCSFSFIQCHCVGFNDAIWFASSIFERISNFNNFRNGVCNEHLALRDLTAIPSVAMQNNHGLPCGNFF
jgi:hypothetical protein